MKHINFNNLPLTRIFSFFVLISYIFLIWIFPYMPLGDLPNHLATINIINQLIHGNSYLDGIFTFNLLKPAILAHLIILALLQFFPIFTSTKIFFSIYFILFYLSVNYFFSTFSNSSQKDLFTLISLLFICGFWFYSGMINFLFSLPFFLIFFTYWNTHRENYTLLSVFFIILPFFHLITFFIFVLAIVIFNPIYIKKLRFFISLIPVGLLNLFWFWNSSFLSHSFTTFPEFNFIFKLFLFLDVSIIGWFFLLIITIYSILSNKKLNWNNNFIKFSLLLFLLFIILPYSFSNWQIVGSRVLLFLPFFVIFLIPRFNKIDLKFIYLFLILFHIIFFIFHFYVFYDFNQTFSHFIDVSKQMPQNSSIGYIPIPFVAKASYSGTTPYLHIQGYLTLFNNSVYCNGLFSNWYNPIHYKKYYLQMFFNSHEDYKILTCIPYIKHFKEILNSSIYPFYDYLVAPRDQCNVTNYFAKNYHVIYSTTNGPILMKLINKSNS